MVDVVGKYSRLIQNQTLRFDKSKAFKAAVTFKNYYIVDQRLYMIDDSLNPSKRMLSCLLATVHSKYRCWHDQYRV